ncbi:MAG: hypothetical protein M1820_009685 [Bogoriella megaspora]|nr:MAG: hypothetical protein M1820_009685 [Bogoriella megaspora]
MPQNHHVRAPEITDPSTGDVVAHPDIFISPPTKQPHKQTFVILHGRGDSASNFATGFMGILDFTVAATDSDGKLIEIPGVEYDSITLRKAFPHTRFVFPEARERPVLGSKSPEWFETNSFEQSVAGDEIQNEGIRETTMLVHALLRQEIDAVGAPNVFLGGLSQGCASSLISLLLWDGEPLGAAFGMCGWLPMGTPLSEILNIDASNQQDDTEAPILKACQSALNYLRDELEFVDNPGKADSKVCAFWKTPIYLSHGDKDYLVDLNLGKAAADCLVKFNARVEWRLEKGQVHWYSMQMLADIVRLVKDEP